MSIRKKTSQREVARIKRRNRELEGFIRNLKYGYHYTEVSSGTTLPDWSHGALSTARRLDYLTYAVPGDGMKLYLRSVKLPELP
jgi:cell division protein FtsB